ncbi:hypothetical protein [Natrinema sp. 1APR25-10V2]|uniref:DUF7534 family protein n=1 Tax=Natrinema sp. 1APR25-10V2 TaxID=2951081 RepID=UPI002876EFDB|nr:hypothetical protein [Natrinema sp. 1APR25-10V2]MDS0475322.1 hypothetical protein [Natrinema sp. 1APR25-10V2]
MPRTTHYRFLRTVGILGTLAVVLSGILSPPDPLTQLLYAGPLLLVAVLLAALRTYTDTLEALEPDF